MGKEIYKDSTKTVEERVEDLLARMTLEEKAAQLCGNLAVSFVENGKVSKEKLRKNFPYGHGRITQYSLTGMVDPKQIAKITNEVQDYFVNETRLGIPVALQSENLCGYPGEGGTLFPAQINVGATWEPELAYEMSSVIGQESRAVGITSAMSPVIDVSRDPRWGRTYETYGEDSYLISQMGINYVKGMQEQGVSSIAKHFLGYAETQAGLNAATTRINDRELYEVFATPFEAADKEAGLDAVMANYAEIDGLPVIDNPKIARTLLRDTMGFEGMLTSDGAAVLKTYNYFKVAKSYEEAGLLAKKAGCDTEIPVGGAFAKLPDYVRNGQLDEKLLDESVRRILTIKFKRGLFENPYCDEEKVAQAMANEEKNRLSREIAAKSLVLLKNDGTLPVSKNKTVAVIGPHGDSLRYPVSGYTYPAYIEMLDAMISGSDDVSFNGIVDEQAKAAASGKKVKGPFDEMFESLYSREDLKKLDNMTAVLRKMGARSLKEALEDRYQIHYAKGCDIVEKSQDGFDEAVKAARESDVVVMALGGNCGWVNVTGGEGKDRCTLDLPGVQQELLETVAQVGKPVIVVLYGPGVFAVNWAKEHGAGIIQAWMPGPYAGEVIADVIDGTANPGGKLNVTIPRSTGQIPIFYNHKNGSGYASGSDATAAAIFSGGYTDGEGTPLFPFGYGLSYTSFRISDLKLPENVPTGEAMEIRCKIANTGEREGDEVLQLYTAFDQAHVVRPNKQLCGFKRVSLKPGESKEVIFSLSTAQLGYYDENMEFVVEPGTLRVMVGTSSENLPLRASVEMTGNKVNLKGKRVYTCKCQVKN
ncbi:MAG TPA: glycoside hydrolase family 3 C-terminal domain-containing protein [Candidatus Blautia pullicola]|uniref:Glycoside hydrolase family 3 C-terminal domain-containing protein n=1 Tax=Candidatus Blautia pullicola TaxID=2838498 RepID=A0A9D2JRE3_9FIRM|nr:glycoside hydrolase family 3 C-terminal domain-containing protein [Candidatus Blautia pullicola]